MGTTAFSSSEFICRGAKPPVYYDGKELGKIHNRRYFTVTVPPGNHLIGANATSIVGERIGSETQELDAEPAATCFYEILSTSNWVCIFDIQKVNDAEAIGAIRDLQPAEAKDVLTPEIVSVNKISRK